MSKKYRRRRRDSTPETIGLLFLAGLVLAGALSSNGGISSRVIIGFVLLLAPFAAAILFYVFYRELSRQKALRLLGLAAVDTMPGLKFEKWVGAQLQARGYKVRYTPINDYGVDIVAQKDGVKTAVQVKRYRNILNQKPIREAVAGMTHYKCSRSMVVTNSSFTQAAKVLAQSNNCELIDREKLAAWLAESQ